MALRATLAAIAAALVFAAAPAILAQSTSACPPTRPDSLGPFYTPGAPERSQTGDGLTVTGTVRSTRQCAPLPGARLEWWSANPRGEYDDAHRATQVADRQGRFRYMTDMPGKYPGRPVHVHVKVTAPGHRTLVTQLYPKPNETSIAFDFVLVAD